MAGLQLKVTPAGRAAIVNLPNTGTAAVQITQIGVTATAFDPATNPSALPGELKRLTTFAGLTVADDTIHVTLRDESADTYSLRGFALYLADGTLFALYGQAGVILEKSPAAMLLLSADVKFADIAATSIEFGDASFANPPATTEVAGVTRHATNAEGVAGSADNRSITASVLKHVLDSRFGLGAPSAFVKGLLALTTAGAFRLALELKGAALKDEGSGNGLDADLLDGQHGAHYLAWANQTGVPATATRWPSFAEITDKPASYTPSDHYHDASRVNTGTFDVARIPELAMSKITGLAAALGLLAPKASPQFSGNVGIGVAGANPLDVLIPGAGRIAHYARGGNTNALASVNAANSAFQALDLDCTALTRSGQTVWDASNFNPGSKANASHTHAWNEVNPPPRLGGVDGNCQLIYDWNAATTTGWYMATGALNAPDADWWMGEVIVHNPEWVVQRVIKFAADVNIEFQRNRYGGTWGGWQRIYNTQSAIDGRYAVKGTDQTFRDLTASRGDGSGVIFLNANRDRYLYYTGTRYELPMNDLKIDGTLICNVLSATSSDARLKDEVEDLAGCLDAVLKMRPRAWRWKSTGESDFGFVAQEHRTVREEFVHVDEKPFEGGDPLLSVRYGKAEPYLVGAVHELVARLDQMSARLRELEGRIAA